MTDIGYWLEGVISGGALVILGGALFLIFRKPNDTLSAPTLSDHQALTVEDAWEILLDCPNGCSRQSLCPTCTSLVALRARLYPATRPIEKKEAAE